MGKIVSPTTYQGGKQRIAKDIIDIITSRNTDLKNKSFYDLCCGSGAITLEVYNQDLSFKNLFMCDISVWGDFWKSIGDGTFLQEMFEIYLKNVPEDKDKIKEYLESIYKASPYDGVELSHVYRFLLLQAGSFGGKQIWIENGKWKNGLE
jgi:site-specific DNA-adenine methylase